METVAAEHTEAARPAAAKEAKEATASEMVARLATAEKVRSQKATALGTAPVAG